MKWAVILVEPRYARIANDIVEPHVYLLGVRDTIQEAEQYRDMVVKEDNLMPNNVSIVSYTES